MGTAVIGREHCFLSFNQRALIVRGVVKMNSLPCGWSRERMADCREGFVDRHGTKLYTCYILNPIGLFSGSALLSKTLNCGFPRGGFTS